MATLGVEDRDGGTGTNWFQLDWWTKPVISTPEGSESALAVPMWPTQGS